MYGQEKERSYDKVVKKTDDIYEFEKICKEQFDVQMLRDLKANLEAELATINDLLSQIDTLES